MSFAIVATVATVATVVNTVNQYNAGKDAERANQQALQMQKEAQSANQENMRKQMGIQEQEFNKRNARTPDAGNMLASAQQAAKAASGGPGAGSTMLTGPAGVDPAALNIGRNTLLGM
jgi:hypothetical protein